MTSIQAWLLDESPGDYRYGEVDAPDPGPGEVWVRVVASALNHLDLWLRQGLPKPPMFPMVPGGDGASTVDAVGEGVTRWQVGDEVVINPSFACGRCDQCLADRSVFCPKWGIMGEHYQGAHGELVVVREANLVAKPASLSWEAAAAYGLCGLTVYRMLRRARLVAGETLLVVGAGGGVGSAALALGQRMGAQVYVTSRDPAKRAHAIELGALGAFPSGEKIPLKADVVVDTAGGPTWALSMGALAPGGRLVTCGGTGGGRVEVNLPRLFFGQFEILGSTMGTFREFDELTRLVAGGLPVHVDSVYPLADYPLALARLEAGVQFGKVVLRHP
ncbi:MAG TPA: alcohol dehydrogenase catalytic domain-containing protein [Acidimicrobiales bacterium]|nr:alcohol dehydrogenase catalytic domain-containing protein [Acidimicrobiales bacterium]